MTGNIVQSRLAAILRAACAACSIALCAASNSAAAVLQGPLPISAAIPAIDHVKTGAVSALSPDGAWLAHTYTDGAALDLERSGTSMQFTRSGVPPLDGRVPHARLTNTSTGEIVELAASTAASWGPSWSPDGTRVAFYSDEGGQLGLWIWSLAERRATRFAGIIPRPHLAPQVARWSPDGTQLLLAILPEGMTLPEANARGALARPDPGDSTPVPANARITVYRHPEPEAAGRAAAPARYPIDTDLCDLAIVDLPSRHVRRIRRDVRASWWAFSPNGKWVAFNASAGIENASTNQLLYDLTVVELRSGTERRLAKNIRLGSASSAARWSPDSRKLAYCTGGRAANGACFSVSSSGGAPTELGAGEHRPQEATLGYETAPLWSADGTSLLLVARGKLLQFAADGSKPPRTLPIADHAIRAIIASPYASTPWSTDSGRSIWLAARKEAGSAVIRWEPRTGHSEEVLRDTVFHTFAGHAPASSAAKIAFSAQAAAVPPEEVMFDVAQRTRRILTEFNTASRHALGTVQSLSFTDSEGASHSALMLLPPRRAQDERHPTIVWLYPGDVGVRFYEAAESTYALGMAAAFNPHIAVTRGYAFLYPRVPVRPGLQAQDITRIVLAAVDAAAARGFTDPERLVVWGQSYGAYATQLLITQTDRFKAAVTTANAIHPDLLSAYLGDNPRATTPGYFESGQGLLGVDPWSDPERYLRNSPALHFDRVRTPLLMAQGTLDAGGMGALAPANAIFTALRRLDKPVELRVYEGEGHGFNRREYIEDLWTRRLEFMAEHLAPKPASSAP